MMALHHLLQVHYNLTCCNVHGRYPLTRAVSNGWREGEHASPGKSCSLASPQSSEIKRAARHGARSGLQVVGNPELPSRAVWPAEFFRDLHRRMWLVHHSNTLRICTSRSRPHAQRGSRPPRGK